MLLVLQDLGDQYDPATWHTCASKQANTKTLRSERQEGPDIHCALGSCKCRERSAAARHTMVPPAAGSALEGPSGIALHHPLYGVFSYGLPHSNLPNPVK